VQVALGVSEQITRVFQGMLLFFVLACDTFIFYRVRLVRRPTFQAELHPREAPHGNA
jgi:simple sugar transport system permease protein